MIVRAFSPADADSVNAVALAAFAQYQGDYDDWDRLVRGVGAMADLAGDGEILVAQNGPDEIMGAVAYMAPYSRPRAEFFEPPWPIIRMLVVDPAVRRRGIGRRLTEECLARARRDGAEAIALHTSPAMAAALALYLDMGFRLKRPLPDRFGVPYGLYLKALDEA